MKLICSAWDEENKYLTQEDLTVKSLGIGYINSILSLQKIHYELKSQAKVLDEIIFIGTCGYFPSNSNLMREILEVNSTEILTLGTVQGNSYVLDNTTEIIESTKKSSSNKVHCLSALEITHEDNIASSINKYYREKNKLTEKDILIENLELYGVAAFAKEHGINWKAFLGVTNEVSKDGHKQWEENHVEVSKKLCEHVSNKLMLKTQ